MSQEKDGYHHLTGLNQAGESLQGREAMLQVLIKLATNFVNVPLEAINTVINKALETIGTFTGVDRVYLFKLDFTNNLTFNTHEWCGVGISPEIENSQGIPFEFLDDLLTIFQQGKIVHISQVADMPEDHPLRALFEQQGIQSMINFPMMHANQCLGFVGFDAVRKIRIFSEMEISLLEILAQLLTNLVVRRRSDISLRESEAKFKAAFEGAHDAIIIFTAEGKFVDCNSRALQVYGLDSKDAFKAKFATMFLPLQPGGRKFFEGLREIIDEVLEHSRSSRFEWDQQRKNGETFPAVVILTSYWLEEGLFIQANIRDITESKRAETDLLDAYRRLEEIIEFLPDATFVIDCEGRVTAWNKAIEKMTQIPKTEMIGRGDYEYAIPFYGKRRPILIDLVMLSSDELDRFRKLYAVIGQSDSTLYSEAYVTKIYDGKGAYLWATASKLCDASGNVLGAIETIRDITERKDFEERLKYYSMHDQLTGLYNRSFFEEELKRLGDSREYPITIITADVDNLKLINDSMGHDQGDQLLIAAATVLKKTLRGYDILARVGGDEFTAILPSTDTTTGESIAARIRINIDRYNQEHAKLPLSLSMGVATAQTNKLSLTEVYKQADDLMYRDKLYRRTKVGNQTVQSLLAVLAERDFITEGHSLRLGELCRKIGERINLSSRQLANLALLAQVHDLGKVGIPDQILLKKGSLSDQEWATMRQHSEKGCLIALASTDLSMVADLILKHHERWDGTGYPLGIKAEAIPVECRILAIVDAYDAMTNQRPYSAAKSRQAAIEELKRCAGSQFDPELAKTFLSILEQEMPLF